MTLNVVLIKLVRAFITIWIVASFAFVILSLTGDPVEILAGDDAPLEVQRYYEQKYGFDKPVWEQYLNYLGSLARGDFGISLSDETPALDLVLEAIPATLQLGFAALVFALVVGSTLGTLAALHRNSWLDRAIMSVAVFGYSIPNFFFGIVLILVFAMVYRLLPSSGSGTWAHLVLPTVTLGTHLAATIARFMRSSVLEVLNQPYVRAAKAKGVPDLQRLARHILPNAAIPVVTILGFRLGDIVAGSIIVETVFAWPGMGRMLVGAVTSRDLAVVQAILVLTAFTMVLANLLVDFLYGFLDPRVAEASDARRRAGR
ncbi:MAG TPA: ABC transporter permease [Kiloniellaceae bacterium]|nr:ABC transporter permease [Kiloniellaceae bacterium]